MNIRHGLGRKEYSNSDTYDGSWKEGVHEGCGTYSWNTGNVYIGHWKAGKMCGRGVMEWANGDIFDGFWLNGYRHRSGVYKFADGSYYFGMWTQGLKDGKGTFYPAGSKHPSLKKCRSSLGYDGKRKNMLSHSSSSNSEEPPRPSVTRSLSEKISVGGFLRHSGRISHRTKSLNEKSSASGRAREFVCRDSSCSFSHISDESQNGMQDKCTLVYEREYMQGVLIREEIRNNIEKSHKAKPRNIFHSQEVKRRFCIDIFKGHRSYYLMLNLQLGIR